MRNHLLLLILFFPLTLFAQQEIQVSFTHEGKTVHGALTLPSGSPPYHVIIVAPGSGPNNRDARLVMEGANAACLYPGLLGDTLRPYRDLALALTDSGYAVLRYDKLEYTYPTSLGTVTFEKLWLPFTSAVDYVKTRSDIDTGKIILLGHSEGAALIPYIATQRNDIAALISVAGARTPFDSLLATQLVQIAQNCGGNVSQAQVQANQILSYFQAIRSNSFTSSTPPLFGVPAAEWYKYVQATDPVSAKYNQAALPSLFLGMADDFNVPPAELQRFQQEVHITNEFWSMSGLNHYMTPDSVPVVAQALPDTIIYWLREAGLSTAAMNRIDNEIILFPNPANSVVVVRMRLHEHRKGWMKIYDMTGREVRNEHLQPGEHRINLEGFQPGLYLVELRGEDWHAVKRLVVASEY